MARIADLINAANWPAIGASTAVISLGLFFLVQIGKPILRRWRMRAPCDAHFTVLALQEVKLDHVLQDDRAHHVKELVLPSNKLVEIEIEYVPKIAFHEESISFGCDGEDGRKPRAIERFDRLITTGKNLWLPGQDIGYAIDRHGYFHIPRSRKRSRGSRIPIGLKLQTGQCGIYPANIFFFTDEAVGKSCLTIRVEDKPRAPMRCILHRGCYVTPLGARP